MALANTLTNFIPTLYAARDIVSRELVGLIGAVTIDSDSARAALNQTVRIHVVPAMASVNITPAMTPPTPNGVTLGGVDMSITKSKAVQIPWSGEEEQSITENGPGIDNVLRDEVAQALRTLTNEVEADLAATYSSFSRSYGTAAQTPFATDLSDPANLRKILDDNGAPASDRQLVINTTAGAKLRTLAQLTKVNEAGTDQVQQRGELINLHGFAIRESAAIATPTKGTGSLYTSDTTGYAVGSTSITLITGTGTILAGDFVTFAGDTNKYIVKTGVAAAGVLVLQEPGLRVALAASAVALTVGGTSAQNMAFQRSSLILLARAPYLPGNRDMATDRTMLTDPVSKLSFEVARYDGYHAHFLEISLAWGVKCVIPRHTAILLG